MCPYCRYSDSGRAVAHMLHYLDLFCLFMSIFEIETVLSYYILSKAPTTIDNNSSIRTGQDAAALPILAGLARDLYFDYIYLIFYSLFFYGIF